MGLVIIGISSDDNIDAHNTALLVHYFSLALGSHDATIRYLSE